MNDTVPWGDYSAGQVEALVSAWLTRVMPGAQRVDGADVRAPLDGGGMHVFEIKSFHQRLMAARRRQIRQSLATAVQRQTGMVRWTLVLPLDLTPAEIRWFERELAASTDVPIDYIGRTSLEAGLSEHRDLLRAFGPGSVEHRAMGLLGEHHAERAAMSRGVIDGVERVQQLRNQLDLTDPDYAFDLREVSPGHTTIAIRPKDPQAADRRPIGGLLSLLLTEGSPVEKAVEDFLRYGRPVTIPGDNVVGIELDLPGRLGELIPSGVKPQISIDPAAEPGWRQRGRLAALRGDRVLATLPVEWDDNTQGPRGGYWLSGRDRSGWLEIIMQVEPDLRGGFTIQGPASDDVLPAELLPVLRFLNVLKQADHIRLETPGHPTVQTQVTGDIVGGPAVQDGGLAIAEALTRIQDATGATFPLPRRWTRKDAEQVYFCYEILRSGSVTWYWPGAKTKIPTSALPSLLARGPLPRLSLSGSSAPAATFELLGHSLSLPGVLRMAATDVLLTNVPALTAQVNQVPAPATVTIDLVADARTVCVFTLDDRMADTGSKPSAIGHNNRTVSPSPIAKLVDLRPVSAGLS